MVGDGGRRTVMVKLLFIALIVLHVVAELALANIDVLRWGKVNLFALFFFSVNQLNAFCDQTVLFL